MTVLNWFLGNTPVIRQTLGALWVSALMGGSLAYGETPTFSHSYIVTTRAQPGEPPLGDNQLTLLPDGKMFFCSAPGHYVQQAADYVLTNGTACTTDPLDEAESSFMPPTSFLQDLEQDIRKTTDGTRTAHLSLYVHGLGLTFPDAVSETAQFGLHFQAKNVTNDQTGTTACTPGAGGGLPKDCILCPQNARKGLYPGLLIGFDWPQFPLVEDDVSQDFFLLSILLDPITAREVRMRADKSAIALVNIFEYVVKGLRKRLWRDRIKLVATLIAHSEGNYLIMKGAQSAVAKRLNNLFDNVLLLAADISSAALNRGEPGGDLEILGKRVTAYHSASDPALLISNYLWSSLHNPSFQARLGQTGPYSRLFNVVGVDATQATNRVIPDISNLSTDQFDQCAVPSKDTLSLTPVLQGFLAVHGSYRCVAEILDDMNMTMLPFLQQIGGDDRRIRVPGSFRHFALQTDDNPPLFSCEEWVKAGFGSGP